MSESFQLSREQIGYAGEYIVITDLIKRGFTPFEPKLPASEIDIIAQKGSELLRIQIKSGLKKENGVLTVDIRKSNRKHGGYDEDSFDVIAIVDTESESIAYLKWTDVFGRRSINIRESENTETAKYSTKEYKVNYFHEFADVPSISFGKAIS